MFWIKQVALLSAFSGIFGLAAPAKNEVEKTTETKNVVPAPLPPLFRCGGQKGTADVKCTIERKMGKKKTGVTHFFTTKSTGANRYELRIEAVLGGVSTLVYHSHINIVDNRATENKYVVQIQASKKKDYSWDISKTDALKATYDLKKNEITFETIGNMQSYYDNNHGMTTAAVRSAVTPPKFDTDNVVKAISAYFVMEYHKAIQAATTNKFPQ
jgi:hypothetical protein